MFGAPLIAVLIIYGRGALGNIDWRLVRTTAWLYAVAFAIYGSVHLIRAAWRADLSRQKEIEDKDELVAKKEAELKEAHLRHVEKYRELEVAKDKQRDAVAKVLFQYKAI